VHKGLFGSSSMCSREKRVIDWYLRMGFSRDRSLQRPADADDLSRATSFEVRRANEGAWISG
jgi:hypothetical protein